MSTNFPSDRKQCFWTERQGTLLEVGSIELFSSCFSKIWNPYRTLVTQLVGGLSVSLQCRCDQTWAWRDPPSLCMFGWVVNLLRMGLGKGKSTGEENLHTLHSAFCIDWNSYRRLAIIALLSHWATHQIIHYSKCDKMSIGSATPGWFIQIFIRLKNLLVVS